MSDTALSPHQLPAAPPVAASAARTTSWWGHGLASLVVVLIVVFGGWYLLNDPTTSPLSVYPLPFNAALFWALMFVVWTGFNLEFTGFNRIRQPWRGVAITAATAAFAVLVTWALGSGLGAVNADFAASRPGGSGYFTGALFVLFGFSTYVLAVVNWAHWPWTDLGLKQPLAGWCEIAFLFIPTLILYVVLGVPSVAAAPTSSVMSLDTLLGWYYAIVVAVVLTGLTFENWPWRAAGSRARTAVAALVGNAVLGTLLYFALLAVCKLLIGPSTVTQLGSSIHQFPAQLGVCWVAWMIMWGNAFGNRPTTWGTAWNLLARAVITLALAIGTFLLYYDVLAGHLLHEPLVAGSLHGNALGFMDWFALVTLLYVVGFESYGIRRPRTADPSDHTIGSTTTKESTE